MRLSRKVGALERNSQKNAAVTLGLRGLQDNINDRWVYTDSEEPRRIPRAIRAHFAVEQLITRVPCQQAQDSASPTILSYIA